jgi:hypothetical protein
MAISIVSREKWGARAPKGIPRQVEWPKGVDLWVHHTTGPRSQTVRDIQAFHQGPSRGWNDIGYHYLIDYEGVIFEGRGREVWGAHSPGKNHEPSVSLIGDYSTSPPSDAQHRSVYALKDHLLAGNLRGHRENTATSCPGNAAMAKVVKGPPPPEPLRYYFERIVNGKTALTWGPYARKIRRDAYWLLIRAAHPTWGLRRYSKEA